VIRHSLEAPELTADPSEVITLGVRAEPSDRLEQPPDESDDHPATFSSA
jgi:hypothetical protein